MGESITNLVDMNLSKLQEIAKDKEAWHAAVYGVAKESGMTERQNNSKQLVQAQFPGLALIATRPSLLAKYIRMKMK